MGEIPQYLEHHIPQLRYQAEKPGSPEEVAAAFMAELQHNSIYPQSPAMLEAIKQAIIDFRNGNYKKVLEEGQNGMRLDRLCKACRYCFLGKPER